MSIELAPLIAIFSGVIIPLLLQTFFLVRWGSRLDARLGALEARMVQKDADDRSAAERADGIDTRLVRVETYMEVVNAKIASVESKQDRAIDAIAGLSASVRELTRQLTGKENKQ